MRKKTVTYDDRMTESLSPLVCMACRMYVCKSDVIKRDGEGDGRTFVNQSQLCGQKDSEGDSGGTPRACFHDPLFPSREGGVYIYVAL
jgi:hypothetical protein